MELSWPPTDGVALRQWLDAWKNKASNYPEYQSSELLHHQQALGGSVYFIFLNQYQSQDIQIPEICVDEFGDELEELYAINNFEEFKKWAFNILPKILTHDSLRFALFRKVISLSMPPLSPLTIRWATGFVIALTYFD